MNRIRSLESLRGLLSLWVVIGHTIKHSGYAENSIGFFKALANPGLAVDVFIILSGFVIFLLLDRQPTTYGPFLVQRWFRLAPMYLFVLFLSAISIGWQTNLIATFPFKNVAILNDLSLHISAREYFPQQILAHLSMLHGAISSSILPNSQYAFVGQSWSISVEWQFYLVAPLIIYLVKNKRWHGLSLFALSFCFIRALNYGGEGFLVNQSQFFIIGISSYYLWKHSGRVKIDPRLLNFITIIFCALIYLALNKTLSLLIWIFVLSMLITEKNNLDNAVQKTALRIFNLNLFQWLGKLSYSVYLIHMLVFYVVEAVVLGLYPNISQGFFLTVTLPTVVVTAVGISALTYRFIEKPGIAIGKKLRTHLEPPIKSISV